MSEPEKDFLVIAHTRVAVQKKVRATSEGMARYKAINDETSGWERVPDQGTFPLEVVYSEEVTPTFVPSERVEEPVDEQPWTIDPDKIVSVYRGKINTCACGCAGDHIYPTRNKDRGEELRGYPLHRDEVRDGAFRNVIRKVEQVVNGLTPGKISYCVEPRAPKPDGKSPAAQAGTDGFVSVDTDTKMYILYLEKGVTGIDFETLYARGGIRDDRNIE